MTSYQEQKRGGVSDYDRYFSAMDKTMQQKLAITAAHFLLKPKAVVADMGCGSGLGSYQLARLNSEATVIGIDINPETIRFARETYVLPNLRFEIGDIEKPDAAWGSFDGILNSSVLHHVYSFNNYARLNVSHALRNQMNSLNVGGMMVIRDFCAEPEEKFVLLEISHEDADWLVRFSLQARALRTENNRGFFLEEVDAQRAGYRRFRLSAKWANEFILRKDYRDDWDSEVLEEYSWWTAEDYRRELSALGGRVVYAAPFWNDWIVDNRYRDKVFLTDESGNNLPYPPTNYIAVVEKVAEGASIALGECAIATAEKGFLKLSSYRDSESGAVYDMVQRTGLVTDCLPYFQDINDRLFIYAKHGYPRPLINTVPRGSVNLDGKRWSGHVVEPLAVVSAQDDFMEKLSERTGLNKALFDTVQAGLRYYPSAGMLDEIVGSVFVAVSRKDMQDYSFPIPPETTGFSTSGEVRLFAAQDMLRAAQVGVLPEARLEMNIYALMRHLNIKPDKWIGGEASLPERRILSVKNVTELLADKTRHVYQPSAHGAGYLKHFRSSFGDFSREARLAQQEFEFVLPTKASANVVTVLALARDERGDLCCGLERRDLPAPQLREGSSEIYVLPAFRLAHTQCALDDVRGFVAEKFAQELHQVSKLGEGYFSSLGLTSERLFPFSVNIAAHTELQQLAEPLVFVRCKDLLDNVQKLRDTNLILALYRALHRLDMWD